MNSIHEPSKEYTLDENSQFTIGRVAQWIRRPTSNRKIVGSIPIVVSFFFYVSFVSYHIDHEYHDIYL